MACASSSAPASIARHTQNVGTVHYMAPEIGKGNYTRAVDIYAAGILLYEMLTGRVPFEGETSAEILLKHLSATPDLSGTGPFAPIVRRALEKDPADRFSTLAEMARRAAEIGVLPAPPVRAAPMTRVPMGPLPTVAAPTPSPAPTTVLLPTPSSTGATANALFVSGGLSLAGGLAWALVFLPQMDPVRAAPTLFLTVICAWVLVAIGRAWRKPCEDSLGRRLLQGLAGAAVGAFAVWLQGYPVLGPDPLRPAADAVRHPFYGALYADNRSLSLAAGYLSYFGLMFLVLRWWKVVEPDRATRFDVPAVLATAFWAFVLLFLLPTAEERQAGFVSMVLTAVVGAACESVAWPRRRKRRRVGCACGIRKCEGMRGSWFVGG